MMDLLWKKKINKNQRQKEIVQTLRKKEQFKRYQLKNDKVIKTLQNGIKRIKYRKRNE